jgi:uncharacterized protein YraI
MFRPHTTALAAGVLVLSAGLAAAVPARVETDLNLRSGPGTDHAIIGTLFAGSVVDAGACAGSWCVVTMANIQGYASRAYLALGADAPAVAVAPGASVVYDDEPLEAFAYGDDPYVYDDDYADGPAYSYFGPSIGIGVRLDDRDRFDRRRLRDGRRFSRGDDRDQDIRRRGQGERTGATRESARGASAEMRGRISVQDRGATMGRARSTAPGSSRNPDATDTMRGGDRDGRDRRY